MNFCYATSLVAITECQGNAILLVGVFVRAPVGAPLLVSWLDLVQLAQVGQKPEREVLGAPLGAPL